MDVHTYRCDICVCNFRTKQHYNSHMNSERHKTRSEQSQPLFTCNICKRSYSHESSLSRHKKIHGVAHHNIDDEVQRVTEAYEKQMTEMKNKFENEIRNLIFENDNMKLMLKIEKMKSQAPIIQPTNTIRRKLTAYVRNQVKEQQDNFCGICKKEITKIFEIDHVIALQYGGSNVMDNLMALCCECHSKKSIAENKCRYEIKECISSIIEKYI